MYVCIFLVNTKNLCHTVWMQSLWSWTQNLICLTLTTLSIFTLNLKTACPRNEREAKLLYSSANRGELSDQVKPWDVWDGIRKVRKDIKQLLDEVEHDIMNYQNRGFDNSWYHAKTKFNNCFIIHFSHNSSSETEAKRSAILFPRRTLQGA